MRRSIIEINCHNAIVLVAFSVVEDAEHVKIIMPQEFPQARDTVAYDRRLAIQCDRPRLIQGLP